MRPGAPREPAPALARRREQEKRLRTGIGEALSLLALRHVHGRSREKAGGVRAVGLSAHADPGGIDPARERRDALSDAAERIEHEREVARPVLPRPRIGGGLAPGRTVRVRRREDDVSARRPEASERPGVLRGPRFGVREDDHRKRSVAVRVGRGDGDLALARGVVEAHLGLGHDGDAAPRELRGRRRGGGRGRQRTGPRTPRARRPSRGTGSVFRAIAAMELRVQGRKMRSAYPRTVSKRGAALWIHAAPDAERNRPPELGGDQPLQARLRARDAHGIRTREARGSTRAATRRRGRGARPTPRPRPGTPRTSRRAGRRRAARGSRCGCGRTPAAGSSRASRRS